MLSHPCIRSYCVLTIVYWYVSGHEEINHRQWLALGGELELDAGVPLGAGGVLPVTLGVQQQDGLPTLHQVFHLLENSLLGDSPSWLACQG